MIYLVAHSWCYGYEDHGWEILKAFYKEVEAEDFLKTLKEIEHEEDEYYIETLRVN